MKYFSKDTVVNSYVGFQNCMTNKSWGYLALLKGCQYKISVGSALEVDLDEVSNFLENIFCLKSEKKKYDSGKKLNAIFSNKWGGYFNNEGNFSPNIYDVVGWAYRRKPFEESTTIDDILNLFAEEFNIPFSVLHSGFNTELKELKFSDSLYLEEELKKELSQKGVDVSQNNITAQKKGVVASPGEISRGPFVQPLYAGLDVTDYVIILQSDFATLYKNESTLIPYKDMSLQQIFYGAPGTGKSFTINKETRGQDVVRTTFHPDSDYSTFVGAYKPTTIKVKLRDLSGHVVVDGSHEVMEDRIVYEFVEQAFLKAYVQAWKNYASFQGEGQPKKEYLVIEEINRGNCAQIFGDLFQLLDRNEKGFSDYPIHADKDMQMQLYKAFRKRDEEGNVITGLIEGKKVELPIEIAKAADINTLYDIKDTVGQVLNGNILLLPNNLYIWATMNTSDQSLFPIDSAFKRRWDWTYVPICKGRDKVTHEELKWQIKVDQEYYDWWDFLEEINKRIIDSTHSEDKQLGFFFCKANDKGFISAETFVSKVVFYLWNDVFKDYGDIKTPFTIDKRGINSDDKSNMHLVFRSFYKVNDEGYTEVNVEVVSAFLKNMGLEPKQETPGEKEDEDGNTSSTKQRNHDKYSVNGTGSYGKNKLAVNCVKEYIKLNPQMSDSQVIADWKSLGVSVPHFIESKQEFQNRTDNCTDRSTEIPCGNTHIYVAHDGYGSNGKADTLMNEVNQKGWGINITVKRQN